MLIKVGFGTERIEQKQIPKVWNFFQKSTLQLSPKSKTNLNFWLDGSIKMGLQVILQPALYSLQQFISVRVITYEYLLMYSTYLPISVLYFLWVWVTLACCSTFFVWEGFTHIHRSSLLKRKQISIPKFVFLHIFKSLQILSTYAKFTK